MKVLVSSTVEKETLVELRELLARLNIKNHKKFIKQSYFLDTAISFYNFVPFVESLPRNKEVARASFSISLKSKNKLDCISSNRSSLISKIILYELKIYKEIEQELESSIVGSDEGLYYFNIDVFEKFGNGIRQMFKTIKIEDKILVRELYGDVFTFLYLAHREFNQEDGS